MYCHEMTVQLCGCQERWSASTTRRYPMSMSRTSASCSSGLPPISLALNLSPSLLHFSRYSWLPEGHLCAPTKTSMESHEERPKHRHFLLFPIVMIEELGWMVIVVSAIMTWALLGIEAASVECERPFHCRQTHLHLEHFCAVVADNIAQLLQSLPAQEMEPQACAGTHHDGVSST